MGFEWSRSTCCLKTCGEKNETILAVLRRVSEISFVKVDMLPEDMWRKYEMILKVLRRVDTIDCRGLRSACLHLQTLAAFQQTSTITFKLKFSGSNF